MDPSRKTLPPLPHLPQPPQRRATETVMMVKPPTTLPPIPKSDTEDVTNDVSNVSEQQDINKPVLMKPKPAGAPPRPLPGRAFSPPPQRPVTEFTSAPRQLGNSHPGNVQPPRATPPTTAALSKPVYLAAPSLPSKPQPTTPLSPPIPTKPEKMLPVPPTPLSPPLTPQIPHNKVDKSQPTPPLPVKPPTTPKSGSRREMPQRMQANRASSVGNFHSVNQPRPEDKLPILKDLPSTPPRPSGSANTTPVRSSNEQLLRATTNISGEEDYGSFSDPDHLSSVRSLISVALEKKNLEKGQNGTNNAAVAGHNVEDLQFASGNPNDDQPLTAKMKRQSSRLFTRKKSSTQPTPMEIEKSMNGEMVVLGNWEKPSNSNSLVQKLHKEKIKMEKEKEEITIQSKTKESENGRLKKWRKLLEGIQAEDKVQIRELEEIVSAASREREHYAQLCKGLEDQCNELLAVLMPAIKDLKQAR